MHSPIHSCGVDRGLQKDKHMTEQQNITNETLENERNFLLHDDIRWDDCPDSVKSPLWLYTYYRINTGGFLRAVLTNDLMSAFSRADQTNKAVLSDICSFIYNNLPSRSHGSKEAYRAWLDVRRVIDIDELVLEIKGENFK